MGESGRRVFLFGIRHHGPGSARSLKAALEHLRPDLLLLEGPPEANAILPLAAAPAMQPPAAVLIYAPQDPGYGAYFPFAVYSPEWQALLYGLRNGIPVQMMDLAQASQMALSRDLALAAAQQAVGEGDPLEAGAPEDESGAAGEGPIETAAEGELAHADGPEVAPPSFDAADPLRMLAEAAGYSESEQWWERMVEQHQNTGPQSANELFQAILEAMIALRESAPPETHPVAIRREAAMRQAIRAGLAAGCQRIAVVCGAWHTPALLDLEQEQDDVALLQGLPTMEVRATWVPWSYARLTRQSGYGAGIDSPGWYGHLWHTEREIAARWMIRVAQLLRAEDLDISPAHVIEAVRLAETLAVLRDHPLPGLTELNEAALTIFCFGNPLPMRLIEEQLIIGDALGSVPPETPMAPLQQDFEREIRRLKLPLEALEKLVDLDLRKAIDLERSHLLHRLLLLGVPWGSNSDAALQTTARGRGGTFHEIWRLKWMPEYTVLLIEAGRWGNTLAGAATARVCQAAEQARDLVSLTGLVEDVLLAELPDAIQTLMRCLQTQAALSSDVRHLMQALPPLAHVLRYGNVRQTDTAMMAQVVEGLAARVWIGLPGACAALNDDAAREMFDLIQQTEDTFNRLANEEYCQRWRRALLQILALPGIHGLLAGRACRLLLDDGGLAREEATRRFGLALSRAVDPPQAAAWVEGFLRGSGQFLIHDENLLGLVDHWLSGLPGPAFTQLLPLLRRTFATFAGPERRNIGERIRRGKLGSQTDEWGEALAQNFDTQRADAVLPLLARLLGISASGPAAPGPEEAQ